MIDHLIPINVGGDDSLANLRPALRAMHGVGLSRRVRAIYRGSSLTADVLLSPMTYWTFFTELVCGSTRAVGGLTVQV